MNEAMARNMSTKDLAKFAEQELENLQLVLATPPAALVELVKRAEDMAITADQAEAMLENYGFDKVQDVEEYLDQVRNILGEFNIENLTELEASLKNMKQTMDEFDIEDAHDFCHEMKRLKKLAQRIEEACTEACIAINF